MTILKQEALSSLKKNGYSWKEIQEHNTAADAWVVMNGLVYDVSDWKQHPGGEVLFTHAGEDATEIFTSFHSPAAYQYLSKFCIGKVIASNGDLPDNFIPEAVRDTSFQREYRQLRKLVVEQGLFEASIPYYVFKTSSNIGLLVLACFIAVSCTSFAMRMLAACILGLFYQQCGWLAHDFLHHQVFQRREYGDLMGILVGNIFQGFSVSWWKNKHNKHHAVPNLHFFQDGEFHGDPDIDTLPLLAWSNTLATLAKHSWTQTLLVRFQAHFYFIYLLFARISWMTQSFLYVFGNVPTYAPSPRSPVPLRTEEQFGLLLHYFGNLMLLRSSSMSLLESLLFVFVSQISCGLMLALVFGVGHNGMAVYDADKEQRPDFCRLQVSTTRNVISTPFVDWFMGGLQYQIEHHLFPTVPRHNLHKVSLLVKPFCERFQIPFHETTLTRGTIEVLQHLDTIAKEFVVDFPAM